MIFLIMAIICSSSIALIFKFSENRNLNRLGVTTFNYVTAFSISFVIAMKKGLIVPRPNAFKVLISEWHLVILKGQGIFSENASWAWSILLGLVVGLFFFLSLIYFQKNVRINGVGLSGAFSKMGVLVPLGLSILLWAEIPGVFQSVGIFLALLSILIVNIAVEDTLQLKINQSLVFLLLLNGLAEFGNKLFQKYALVNHKELFLFIVFLTAFFISIYFTIKQKKSVRKTDILIGIAVGIPNLFSSFFLILALNQMMASVVFPVYSAGTIIFINAGGYFLYKERLSKKELAAIVMIAIALILINL